MRRLRGLDCTAPWLTGLLRGAVEAAVIAVLAVAGDALLTADVPEGLRVWVPAALLLVRTLEGVADGIDPEKRRSRGHEAG